MFAVTSCSKEVPGPSGGLIDTKWIPVHAKGSVNSVDYSIVWDDDVNPDGSLTVKYMRNGEEVVFDLLFDGYYFFKDKNKNLFLNFRPSMPSVKSIQRRYYVKDGSLYLETLSTIGDPSSSMMEEPKPTGQYKAYILTEFSADYITFDGVTYKRM